MLKALENAKNIKIFIPNKDTKDEYGCLDKIIADTRKLELNYFRYKTPDGFLKEEYFDKICKIGLKERYGNNISQEVLERYEKEKSAIIKSDCVDIFLYYHDIVEFAHQNDIMIGTGRGDSVNSLICYILGITNIDPIKYNLPFERFFYKSHNTLLDIILDIEEENSDLLLNLILKKFGNENVAIASIPSYSDNIEDERSFQTILFITEEPIKNYLPLDKIAPDTYLTLVPYEKIENLCCLKIRIHFLKVLDRIKNSKINLNEIPLNSEKVFSLFQNDKTAKIYAYGKLNKNESDNLKRLKPESIEGPIEQGMFDDFIKAKDLKSKNKYTELIEPILEETYGEIIYQEQIIQILNMVGDFSLSESEEIRRYMARTSVPLFDEEKTFIENAISKGIKYTNAQDLWNKMHKVSPYCFMKSHALSSSLLSYYDSYIQVN